MKDKNRQTHGPSPGNKRELTHALTKCRDRLEERMEGIDKEGGEEGGTEREVDETGLNLQTPDPSPLLSSTHHTFLSHTRTHTHHTHKNKTDSHTHSAKLPETFHRAINFEMTLRSSLFPFKKLIFLHTHSSPHTQTPHRLTETQRNVRETEKE